MQLPQEILSNLNLSVSRHKDPASLDWVQVGDHYEATLGDQRFRTLYAPPHGFVIAEMKFAQMGIEG